MTHNRFAGACAILAGIAGFVYSISFVILKNDLLNALLLSLGALLTSVVIIGLYRSLRETDPLFASWGLFLGVGAAMASLLHGGYDLANAINPPDANLANLANLPSQTDPRGLATFAITGLAVFVFSSLMVRSMQYPRALGYLGYLLGALLIVVYLGRLVILEPGNLLLLGPAALTGFIVNPIWYFWLGSRMLSAAQTDQATQRSRSAPTSG